MSKEVILRDGKPLITRFRFSAKKLGGIYIHRLDQKDEFPPHDHPWTFWSFILWGGYDEAIYSSPTGVRRSCDASLRYKFRDRWSLHRMGMEDAHLIFRIRPHTWTFVVRGPRRRQWGFWEWEYFRPARDKDARSMM